MEKLKDYTLEIIVMDKDRIGRNECIGKVNEFFFAVFQGNSPFLSHLVSNACRAKSEIAKY